MAPKVLLALHEQDLADTMRHLKHHPDFRARQVFAMGESDNIYPLNEATLKPLRRQAVIFDDDEYNSPILFGEKNLPFDALPPPSQIQKALTKDINDKTTHLFAPSLGSSLQDTQATTKLLQNIDNPGYNARGAIIHMSSPSFDALHTKPTPWPGDGILGQSNFHMNIAPALEVFDLEFSQSYYFNTLLTGLKIWIAFPPRHGNPVALQRQFNNLADDATGSVFLPIASALKHGIVIVQKPGDTLMMPPYWAYMAFSVETSASAAYFLATVLKFMERLLSIDLQVSAIMMWPGKAKQQAELIWYVDELATHLNLILNEPDSFEAFSPDGMVDEMCLKWDEELEHGMLKLQVCRLCNLIEDEGERTRVQRIWQAAWIMILNDRRGKRRPECQLCKVKLSDMYGSDMQVDLKTQAHFVAAHWIADPRRCRGR